MSILSRKIKNSNFYQILANQFGKFKIEIGSLKTLALAPVLNGGTAFFRRIFPQFGEIGCRLAPIW